MPATGKKVLSRWVYFSHFQECLAYTSCRRRKKYEQHVLSETAHEGPQKPQSRAMTHYGTLPTRSMEYS